MADKKNSAHELAEALEDVYGAADLRAILDTVRWRSDVPRDQIARRVDRAAWWYKSARRLLKENRRPSERERRLKRVLRKLRAAATAVQELSPNDRNHLEAAGQDLAKANGSLPDVQPEPVELPKRPGQSEAEFMNVWDTRRQIVASLERLSWLVRCVERAIERVARDKATHGSPIADEALHTTIWLLQEVFFGYAADPHTPGANIGDGSAESRTWREGELLDFLEAGLKPLGVLKTREAIYADWRRAIAAFSEH